MHPLRVYLDSSDYSVLSDPRRRTSEMASVLDDLRGWLRNGQIVCYFSGIHLSEMAPLKPQFADAANRRANLLVELCGRNTLISLDRLYKGEVQFALGVSQVYPMAYSSIGEWYPEGLTAISPVGELELVGSVADAIKKCGLNRQGRRLAKRKALKGEAVRAGLKSVLVNNARLGSLEEILMKYPMRPQDARVLSRYCVGDATREEAANAFQESLRDPSWVMQWFANHHTMLSPFIEWARAPATSMLSSFATVVNHATELRKRDAVLGTALADELMSPSQWAAWQNDFLVRIASRLSETITPNGAVRLTVDAIDRDCPGLSVCFRSLHEAWRSSIAQTPRQPRSSDPVDALHAAYAPYVDVFRADSFMSQYVAKRAARYGTKVVSKLLDLPVAIRAALFRRGVGG
jgi:hypothetical protein